jgi:hypothetical protein
MSLQQVVGFSNCRTDTFILPFVQHTHTQALYLAEQKAREAVETRARIQHELLNNQKERKEDQLRKLAQQARIDRVGGPLAGSTRSQAQTSGECPVIAGNQYFRTSLTETEPGEDESLRRDVSPSTTTGNQHNTDDEVRSKLVSYVSFRMFLTKNNALNQQGKRQRDDIRDERRRKRERERRQEVC